MTWQAKLQELIALEEGLTDWEVNFVDDMETKRKLRLGDDTWPTQKQLDKLDIIYESRIVEGRTGW